MNKVILIGNLGKDPELLRFDNGGIITKFPLATSEKWKDKEGNLVEHTEWHNIVVKRKGLAEVCEKYLNKGSKVAVEGKIHTRKWEGEDGNPRYSTEIHVFECTFLSGNENAGGANISMPTGDGEGDDPPF